MWLILLIFFVVCWFFWKLSFSYNSFTFTISEYHLIVWVQIRPDPLVQTVCKDYQQTTKVSAELKLRRDNSTGYKRITSIKSMSLMRFLNNPLLNREHRKTSVVIKPIYCPASQECQWRKVIRDLELIDHLCINPIHRIGLIHKWSVDLR